MEIYSLFELNQYIRQVVALNFVDSIWISAEISQVSFSRGHCYMELIENDEVTDQIKAKSAAVIWYKELLFIKKKLGKMFDKIFQEGVQVKLKVELDFHERYGFKLLIKDIDPAFTYGQMAIQREQIIEKLKSENRLGLNKEVNFPTIIQKIAVISSETAAGFQDLVQHLENNPYDYEFVTQLYPAAMQGTRVEMEVIAQLKSIKESGEFDVVVITRGGGSKLDLAGFDSYHIAKEISEMNIPVITGIGHDIDESIADLVSALALKTPTAVANFIIDLNTSFETKLYDMAIKIKLRTQERFRELNSFLDKAEDVLRQNISQNLQNSMNQIILIEEEIPIKVKRILGEKLRGLEHMEAFILASSPEKLLRRGYSISYHNGAIVKSIKDLKQGSIIEVKLIDGQAIGEVKDIKNDK